MVTIRYFAAAAEAAGVPSETVAATTVAELRRDLVARHGQRMGEVLPRCSLLIDGVRAGEDATRLLAGTTVDVLPPFAGG